MRVKKIVALAVLIISLFMLSLVFMLSYRNESSSSVMNVLSYDDCSEYLTRNSFKLEDMSDLLPSDSGAERAFKAIASNRYQIEYYELSSDNIASAMCEKVYKGYANTMSNGKDYNSTKSEGSNYKIYQVETNDKFILIERVNSIVVYVNSKPSCKDDILKIVKNISNRG